MEAKKPEGITRRHFLRNALGIAGVIIGVSSVGYFTYQKVSSHLATERALSVIDMLDSNYTCKSLADNLIEPRGVAVNPDNNKVYFIARYRMNCWSGDPTGYSPYELNESPLRMFVPDPSRKHDPDDHSPEADERRKWERHNWPHKSVEYEVYDRLLKQKKPSKIPVTLETVGHPENLVARVKTGYSIESDDFDNEGNIYLVINPSENNTETGVINFDEYWEGQGKIIKISKR